jgi:sugar/nucleoside kinase (ribokinase family)
LDLLARAVFVGLATWDTIALVPAFPRPDGRVQAMAIVEAGGGPAATAAVACARLGVPTAFIGAIGDDDRGRRILEGLASEGVDVSGVMVVPDAASAAAVVIADAAQGTRALCPTLPPALDLAAGSRQAAMIAQAQIVHVDQAGYGPVMALAGEGKVLPPLSVDAGNRIDGLDPSNVTLFVPTLARLAEMFGGGEPAALLSRVRGPVWAVATDGAAGAYFCSAGICYNVPAFAREHCVSTLGAGDVFHGALVAAWVRDMKLAEAVAYASVAAGMSCAAVDGRSAVPDHQTAVAACGTPEIASRQFTEV